jgi:signal transduction histidine kinase/ligand-binding sensor domain-containing protein/ActR/RegA family two-component response regulator
MALSTRRVIQVIVLIFAALMVADRLHAQHYLFRQFGQAEGLKSLSIRCLTQTRQGFLWVGTENGLFRFDGQNFKAFTTAQGLPSNWIQAVKESEDGTLWVGTSAGLITLRHGVWQTLGQDPPVVYYPQSIAPNGRGTVYIAASQGLLEASWGGGFWKLEPVPGVPRTLTRTVYPDGDNVWFTSKDALWRLNGAQLTQFSSAQGLPDDEEWAGIIRDAKGDLYVRSRDSLRVLHPRSKRFELVSRLPNGNMSDQLSLDSEGKLVIPTDEGLRRVNGSLLAGPKNGLPDDPACCLLTDKEGLPWIGTATQGLYLWAGSQGWEGYSEQDGLDGHIVNAIHRDEAGRLWIGTRRSLDLLMASKLSVFSKARWMNQIRAVRSTPDGTVWVATLDNGLAAVNPVTRKIQVMDVAQGFSAQRIVGLDVIDKQLWVYTRQGVFVADFPEPWGAARTKNWHFRRWTALESFAPETRDKSVYRLMVDHQGRLWAATLAGLFVQEKSGKWQRFSWRDRLLEDAVTFLTEDASGRIWIGYSSNLGVSRLVYEDGQLKIEHFSQKNYLTSNVINFVERDARGWIWVGTDSGVDVWRPNGWRHYDTEDGLIGSDTSFNGFLADKDGSVWIGTSRGLGHFDIPEEEPPSVTPTVALTDVEMNGRRVDGKRLSSPLPSAATVKLRFSVLSFRERQRARFRFRLLGLDDQWIDDASGDAVFPNLGYGQYKFQVKAYHPIRGWITDPAELSFQIAPLWWQTPWAIAGSVLFLAFAVVGAWRWRVRALVAQKNALTAAVNQRTTEIRAEKATVEQQKQQIEELLVESQRVNRLKDEFLANISHEIRTPLHGVLGMTGLALGTPLSEEQKEYLQLAEQSARSLLHLLNDILDFSKIQSGKLTLQNIPFSLRACVEKATGAIGVVARKKGLEFRVLVADDLPAAVTGDPDRLQQVLGNLANNAVKFTERGRVQILVFRDPTLEAGDRIHFSVRDTGQGIPRDKWTAVFEPFRQADGSTTRRFGGTGLGLSISNRLIEQMGGHLTLDSEVGVGSIFSFIIPLPEPERPKRELVEPKKHAVDLQPLKVLLVDGNPLNVKIGVRQLERQGCEVSTVPTSVDALELLSQSEFDLIVIDLERLGSEATGLIRDIRRGEDGLKHTPTIVLASRVSTREEEEVLNAGADAYLSRPVQALDLKRVLATSATS